MRQAESGNGFATAALVLGILGVALGLMFPIVGSLPTYIVVVPCGILAFTLGIVGRRRSTRMGDPNRGTATAGTALGMITVALGISGVVFVI